MRVLFRSRSLAAGGLLALALASLIPATASARPEPGYRPKGFRLFARVLGSIGINRVVLGLSATRGNVGTDSTGTGTVGGGYWPKGTANQFVFNAGLQIAGIVDWPGGAWDGDTTAAYFFNARGGGNGDAIQPVYNFQNPADAAAWPIAAKVPLENNPDDNFYSSSLSGLNSASQGDIWFVTWDGNLSLGSDRPHPLGIAVETRGLGWNFPSGNEDIVYFVFTFYNISASNPAVYANVRPAFRPIAEKMGADFAAANLKAGTPLPPDGYTIKSAFSSFGADMDVADFSNNYCSVNLPFAMGFCWENSFQPAAGESYDNPTIWGAPFFPGVGLVGVKYLRSPTGAGEIQLFSNTANTSATTGTSPFPDPQGSSQLYRYLSGNFSAALDRPCNVPGGRPNFPASNEGICFISVDAQDARFYQSSTELTLKPGELKSIVVAFFFAAPVAIPNFVSNNNTDVKPGNPVRLLSPTLLAQGANTIDSIAGFNGFADIDGDGVVKQSEVKTIPGSLLQKALVAQAIFDTGFLLPFAPESPPFYLIPGNNSVTILWQPSATEVTGDPYFAVASAPLNADGSINALYDPNYRQYDVEGYRIYRGRVNNSSALTLVQQFDYSGTEMNDFTGQIRPVPTCNQQLGVIIDCPQTVGGGTYTYVSGSGLAPNPTSYVPQALVGEFNQIKLGSESSVVLADGTALVVANADTALTSAKNGSYPPLANTGVPFAYVDREPKNNFRYFYAVTAFDINSFQSGQSSLESSRTGAPVTPSVVATNTVNATLTFGLFGDAPDKLDTEAPFTIDAATGIFSGTPPATNGVAAAFAPLIPALLPALELTATIDSVTAFNYLEPECGSGAVSNGLFSCYVFYTHFDKDGVKGPDLIATTPWPAMGAAPVPESARFDTTGKLESGVGKQPVNIDQGAAAAYGIPGTVTGNASVSITQWQYIQFSSLEGQAGRRNVIGNNGGVNAAICPTVDNCPTSVSPGGSRWFQGANETRAHPAVSIKVGGGLTGVDTVWAPIHHVQRLPLTPTVPGPTTNNTPMQYFGYGFAGLSREADVVVTWGTGGKLASVHDVTHDVEVPFSPIASSSWGFVTDANEDNVIDWPDFNYIPNVAAYFINEVAEGGIGPSPYFPTDLADAAGLVNTAAPLPLSTDYAPVLPTGTGVGLYINGERYLFKLTNGLPPEGTQWTLRTYSGTVRASTATAATNAPSGYAFNPVVRSPSVPGLKIKFNVTKATGTVAATNLDLTKVHTVPDPYYVTNGYEATTENKVLQFVNLPSQAIIRIYTSSGILVNLIEHNSTTFSGAEPWNLRNRNNQVVASGVYFYMIEAGDARRVGRFTVVNFAQ